MNPEREQQIRDKLAAFQLKYNVVLTPEIMKQAVASMSLQDPVTWGMANRALKGEPYRFELPVSQRNKVEFFNRHRPFLAQMLADQAPNKCYEKSRQCGASESSVTEVLWFLATHHATKAIYVFPTKDQMQDFANSRIDPALDETEYMKSLRGKIDNVGMKQIGRASYLVMRSGQTPRAGEGVDADCLYIDEKDRMSDKIESAFEQSLSASRYKILREFSTPTLPGSGIDKSFNTSSQNFWFVKCDSGHSQTLKYPENILVLKEPDPTHDYVQPGSYSFRCERPDCPSAINRWDGEWVAKYPERGDTHAGYHINQLSCVWLSADQIMGQLKKYRFKDIFYNYVLGLPYASDEGLISAEALYRCIDRSRWLPGVRLSEYSAVVAGIDWGHLNWCVVLGRRRDGKYEVCGLKWVADDADVLIAAKSIADFLEPFNPNYIVADMGYGRDRNMELLRRYPDRVYGCFYTSGTANDKSFLPVWSDTNFRVTVNRTAHLRNMLESTKMQKIIFPGKEEDYQVMFKHILSLALIHQEEEDPETRVVEIIEKIGKTGDDHYAHAYAYALLAMEKITNNGILCYEFI
jgi:hypothetical protein